MRWDGSSSGTQIVLTSYCKNHKIRSIFRRQQQKMRGKNEIWNATVCWYGFGVKVYNHCLLFQASPPFPLLQHHLSLMLTTIIFKGGTQRWSQFLVPSRQKCRSHQQPRLHCVNQILASGESGDWVFVYNLFNLVNLVDVMILVIFSKSGDHCELEGESDSLPDIFNLRDLWFLNGPGKCL